MLTFLHTSFHIWNDLHVQQEGRKTGITQDWCDGHRTDQYLVSNMYLLIFGKQEYFIFGSLAKVNYFSIANHMKSEDMHVVAACTETPSGLQSVNNHL